MLKRSEYYIDLGTANTIIFSRESGFVLNEPTCITVRNSSQVFALGRSAKQMLGKTPENLNVIRPLSEGVIADLKNTEQMLSGFLNRVRHLVSWRWPKLVISLPCQVTSYEKKAVKEVAFSLGAKKVYLVEEPLAAAVGAGLSVLKPFGQMVVDIGGGTTEIAIVSAGGIVFSLATRVGGQKIDEDIATFIEQKYRFQIGPQTAERIKVEHGSALTPDHPHTIQVQGQNLLSRLPGILNLTTEDVHLAMEPTVREILNAIRRSFLEIPPEVSTDIFSSGIVLAGGGALIRGLAERVERETGIFVRVAENPLLSVALGGTAALANDEFLERICLP